MTIILPPYEFLTAITTNVLQSIKYIPPTPTSIQIELMVQTMKAMKKKLFTSSVNKGIKIPSLRGSVENEETTNHGIFISFFYFCVVWRVFTTLLPLTVCLMMKSCRVHTKYSINKIFQACTELVRTYMEMNRMKSMKGLKLLPHYFPLTSGIYYFKMRILPIFGFLLILV